MRRLSFLCALLAAAVRAPGAQQSGGTISGEVSIVYADLTPWMRNSGARSSTFAMIYDAAADRSYQVSIDSSLTRAYGGLEGLRGKTVSLRVGAMGRATAIMSVADKRPARRSVSRRPRRARPDGAVERTDEDGTSIEPDLRRPDRGRWRGGVAASGDGAWPGEERRVVDRRRRLERASAKPVYPLVPVRMRPTAVDVNGSGAFSGV